MIEYQHYSSDITCIFSVNGKFSQPQREVYDFVLTGTKFCFTYINLRLLFIK
ncbi:MAG: M24 family metallopeptidase [Arsenophonus sp. NC-QC1-MAG3]